jgi:hypothetical protein
MNKDLVCIAYKNLNTLIEDLDILQELGYNTQNFFETAYLKTPGWLILDTCTKQISWVMKNPNLPFINLHK